MIKAVHLFHKYSVAVLYLLIIISFYISGEDYYDKYSDYFDQSLSIGLFMCLHLFSAAVVYKKCVWQKGCIVGIAAYCIINISYSGNYGLEYYDRAQFLSFSLVSCYVSAYIYLEEIKGISYKTKRENNYANLGKKNN
jgi:hypothetical protein